MEILLVKHPQEDICVWSGELTGESTVRSSYGNLLTKNSNQEMANNNIIGREFYNNLWHIDIPNKIRITNWRIYNNYIPTFRNLYNKRISNSVMCLRCKEGPETLEHAIRDCPTIQEVWLELNFGKQGTTSNDTLQEWIREHLTRSSGQ
ncbi:hypothetical protein CXB51_008543 [Gossypium anomalum]|uniref:Reverse transcriptase zinc-binding domain-containing protein n=1 Tax=Gossypium anomalum TaxID=47600 RepID=A0A8J6DAM5_9ROSI|nr:hypothetical protein CXB51_008543 [Gossypium anomalum]